MTGVCLFCNCTWDSMERRGDGEPCGWETTAQNRCLGEHCIAQRPTPDKRARRELRNELRTAALKLRERTRARKTKHAARAAKRRTTYPEPSRHD